MNRIAALFPDTQCVEKQFRAECSDIMRKRTGLTTRDVHLLVAGYSPERSLWEVRLHLTKGIVFQVGCECEETVLDLWRSMMPAVKEAAMERGIGR